jgi:hypothetical protein
VGVWPRRANLFDPAGVNIMEVVYSLQRSLWRGSMTWATTNMGVFRRRL